MKHYKTEEKTIVETTKHLEYIECDICRKKYKEHVYSGCEHNSWVTDVVKDNTYEFESTQISMSKGCQYPECRSYVTESFDICPDCFQKEIIDHLKEKFNIAPESSSYDF